MANAILLILLLTRLALALPTGGASTLEARVGPHKYHYRRHWHNGNGATVHSEDKSVIYERRMKELCTEAARYQFEDFDASTRTELVEVDQFLETLRGVDPSSLPTVRLRLHGLPCVHHGCCNYTMLLRPKSSDIEVMRHAIKDYSVFLFKIRPFVDFTSILDGGGNIGIASVFFAHLFPLATIVAVEPHPMNCLLLKANTLALPNVRVHCKGLWNRAAKVAITKGGDGRDWGWKIQEVENGTDGVAETTTVTDLLELYQLESFDFVKLDIEGAEFQVLGEHANLSWLNKTQVIATEIHGYLGSAEQLEQIKASLADYNFLASRSGEYEVYTRQNLHSKLI